MRWRLDARSNLKRVELDALTAIYDRQSGMTHLLADPMPDLIDALAAGAADEAMLLGRLGIEAAEETDRAGLRDRLAELEAVGLAVRL